MTDDNAHGADGSANTTGDSNIYNEADEIKRKTMFDEGIYHELADVAPSANSSANTDQNEPQQSTSHQSASYQSAGTKLVTDVNDINRIKQLKKASGSFYLDMSCKKFSDTMIKLEDLKTVIYQKLADKKFDTEYQVRLVFIPLAKNIRFSKILIHIVIQKQSKCFIENLQFWLIMWEVSKVLPKGKNLLLR